MNTIRELSLGELDEVSGAKSVTIHKSKGGNTYYVGEGFFSIKLKNGDYVQLSPSGAGGRIGGKPI